MPAAGSIVNVAAMADFQDEDGNLLILDCADKPIIAHTITPRSFD